ncbi:hypothetical protein [Thaumasiovibrio subtropicus]|uniref:hypothetical protein n=1 Tax=Thaumasiovibrio subtropicus TaxID=1891207 RepID=UPI00131A96E7|nr:hypothetical protein [Thaumasiovibrio subtropicus]
MKNNMILAAGVLSAAVMSASVFAEEIDPADLTKVYTQTALMIGGNSDIKPVTMISGAYSNGHQFAFLGEATFGDVGDNQDNDFGFKYKDARAQYFHTLDSGFSVLPKAGFSFDYINQRDHALKVDTNLFAIGTLAAVNPKYTPGFMAFPMVAYVNGEMDIKPLNHKESVDGFSVAFAATKPLGDSGAFLLLWPEYQNISGDHIKTETVNFKVAVNAPMTQNRKLWVNTRFDLSKAKTTILGNKENGELDSEAYLGLRYFF